MIRKEVKLQPLQTEQPGTLLLFVDLVGQLHVSSHWHRKNCPFPFPSKPPSLAWTRCKPHFLIRPSNLAQIWPLSRYFYDTFILLSLSFSDFALLGFSSSLFDFWWVWFSLPLSQNKNKDKTRKTYRQYLNNVLLVVPPPPSPLPHC